MAPAPRLLLRSTTEDHILHILVRKPEEKEWAAGEGCYFNPKIIKAQDWFSKGRGSPSPTAASGAFQRVLPKYTTLQCVMKQSLATCGHPQYPHKQDTQLRSGRREPQKPGARLWPELGRKGDSSLEQQGTDKAGDATCSTEWDQEAFLLSTWLNIHFLLLTLTGTGSSAGSRLWAEGRLRTACWWKLAGGGKKAGLSEESRLKLPAPP